MNSPYWFEVAVMCGGSCIGNVVLSAFAEQEPKVRRLVKLAVGVAVAVGVSAWLGRGWFFALMGLYVVVFTVIHGWLLPRRGINGLTAEPRERYRAMRGWK
jgi:hypothetical protein